jgi:ABC-type dipeptide/oligopeptide/nickel transport system permease component
VPPSLVTFIARRTLTALLLVILASSAALGIARLAPGDHLPAFEMDPAVAAAERKRLGIDRPLATQYVDWLRGLTRLDLGASTRYPGRSVAALLRERAGNSIVLGLLALGMATLVGVPLGVVTGSRRQGAAVTLVQSATIVLLSIPPIVLSLLLLLMAARTGWFPIGGLPGGRGTIESARYFVLPVLALALPVVATLERLQARSMRETLRERSIVAARARGVPRRRLVWRHAFRLSIGPVLSVYGVIIGALISGSFVVEYVMAWPGLGRLMYDGLLARDGNLVAGCAATGAALLALGILTSDIARAAADPRLERPA